MTDYLDSLFAPNLYPQQYAQGKRYQQIQGLLNPSYTGSPLDIYNQGMNEIGLLSAPSVPEYVPFKPAPTSLAETSPMAPDMSGDNGGLGAQSYGSEPGGFTSPSMGNMSPGTAMSIAAGFATGGPIGGLLAGGRAALAGRGLVSPSTLAQMIDKSMGLDSLGLNVDVAAIDSAGFSDSAGDGGIGDTAGGFGGIGDAGGFDTDGGFGDDTGVGGFA